MDDNPLPFSSQIKTGTRLGPSASLPVLVIKYQRLIKRQSLRLIIKRTFSCCLHRADVDLTVWK